MKNWEGRERRRFPRLKGAVVEYSILNKDAPLKLSFTENISAVGVRILILEKIKKNTILSLSIYLPNHTEPIKTKGKVVWVRKSPFLAGKKEHYDLGIEFEEIDEDSQKKICQYVVDQTVKD